MKINIDYFFCNLVEIDYRVYMNDYGLISLLPPVVAIGLALWTREVFLSLLFGIWVWFLILAEGNLFNASF